MSIALKTALIRFARGLGSLLLATSVTYVLAHLGDFNFPQQYQFLVTLVLAPLLQALDKYLREKAS